MRLPFGFKGYVNVRSCTRFERTRHACGVIDTIFRDALFSFHFFLFLLLFLSHFVVLSRLFLSLRRSSFYLFIYFTRKFKTMSNFFFSFSNRSVTFGGRLNSYEVFARKERNEFGRQQIFYEELTHKFLSSVSSYCFLLEEFVNSGTKQYILYFGV